MPELCPESYETTTPESEATPVMLDATEPPLDYDYIYPPSRNIITHNKERIARVKRCLACLDRQTQAYSQEEAPPITPANLSLCIGTSITTDHLRTLAKRGIIEEVGTGRSSPFSGARNPESIFAVRDAATVPYKTGQRCNYNTARYRQILETRKPASLSILENIVDLPRGIETFRRSDLIKEAGVTTGQVRDFIAKFVEAGYITLVDARSNDYAVTNHGQEFFDFTRKVIRVRTDNRAHYQEFDATRVKKVLLRKSLSVAERTLFDQLADISPPYSAADIMANRPFSRSTIRSLFSKLEEQDYIVRAPRQGKSVYYRLTTSGYALLENEEDAARAEEQIIQREQARQQRLVQHLLSCEFLRLPDRTGTADYQLGPYSAQFSPVHIHAYLYANNLSHLVHSTILDEHSLNELAKQRGGTITSLANIVASDIGAAPQTAVALNTPVTTVLQGILKCISCMEERGVHQEGAPITASKLMRCAGSSKKLVGIALRVLSEQDTPAVVRDQRQKRHARYLLAKPPLSAPPEVPTQSCQKIMPTIVTPKPAELPALQMPFEPTEQYPILKQAKEQLERRGVLNDNDILSALQQCLDKRLLVVKKVVTEDIPQVILRNPTYDQRTRSYIAFNAKFTTLSPMARRAIAHHLGVDIILHGQTEDPRVLKHAVGLASTDNLGEYVEKIIASLSHP